MRHSAAPKGCALTGQMPQTLPSGSHAAKTSKVSAVAHMLLVVTWQCNLGSSMRPSKCWVTALSFCTQKVSITHLLAQSAQATDVRMHVLSPTCGSVSLQKSAVRLSSQLLIAAMPAESAFAAFSRSSKSSMEGRLRAQHEQPGVVKAPWGSKSQIACTIGRSNAMSLHSTLQLNRYPIAALHAMLSL